MANTNAPFGFRQLGLNQSPTTPSFSFGRPRKFAANNGIVCARGDGLQQLATGYIAPVAAAAVPRSQWIGIFMGCEYLSLATGRKIESTYWPGNDSNGDVTVFFAPLIGQTPSLWLAQTTLTPVAFADIGANVDITYTAPVAYSGSGKSRTTIDIGSVGTSADLPWHIEGLYSEQSAPGQPGTDDTTSYNWVVVSFNSDYQAGLTA